MTARKARSTAPGPSADDYVVRIYRWGAGAAGPPPRLVGVVEQVGVEGRLAFGDLDELWRILSARKKRRAGRERRRESRRRSAALGYPPDRAAR